MVKYLLVPSLIDSHLCLVFSDNWVGSP